MTGFTVYLVISGLYKDAEAAMDFILKRTDIDLSKIIVFGRSLGGAVAIYLASQPFYAQQIAVLIVENTFTSLPEIGRNIFKLDFLKYVPDILFKAKVSTCRIMLVYYCFQYDSV